MIHLLKLDMVVYLCTKFQVSSKILTGFILDSNITPSHLKTDP